MSLLEKLERGRSAKPPRILCYGVEGVGKSTFASQAPKPVFIQCEDGLDEIDVDKFPLATKYDQVTSALTDLQKDPHDYESVVIDSLDWLERLIFDRLCAEHNASTRRALDFMLHQTRRMLFMAHSHVAENPFHAECLKLVRKLRDAPNQQLAHSVLLKRMKTDAKTFQELVTTLEQQGDLLTVLQATNGRPQRTYRLLGETCGWNEW